MPRPKADLHAGNLKYSHKAAIVKYRQTHPDASYKRIAEWARIQFNLHKTPSESTISRTLQERDQFINLSPQDESIQTDLRWKIREEERIRHVHAAQPSITSFFNSKS